jgi:hypothetical protein
MVFGLTLAGNELPAISSQPSARSLSVFRTMSGRGAPLTPGPSPSRGEGWYAKGSRARRRILLLAAVVALAMCAAILWFALSASATSTQSRFADTALRYGQQYMTWSSGPSVQSTQIVPLRGLEGALAATVPSATRRSVNVSDLLRRYGPGHRVALVVLRGVYNSLPPDEGVTVTGDVVVLVDVQSDRVLLLTA